MTTTRDYLLLVGIKCLVKVGLLDALVDLLDDPRQVVDGVDDEVRARLVQLLPRNLHPGGENLGVRLWEDSHTI